MPLTILAQITAAPGKEDFLREALLKIIEPTRAEAGCIQYDLHQDNSNPGFFVFFEIWESRELWQDHMVSPHIKAHGAATEGAVANVVLSEMSQIG